MDNSKKIRLIQVAKEFKVGLNTIVDFLLIAFLFSLPLSALCHLHTDKPMMANTSIHSTTSNARRCDGVKKGRRFMQQAPAQRPQQ